MGQHPTKKQSQRSDVLQPLFTAPATGSNGSSIGLSNVVGSRRATTSLPSITSPSSSLRQSGFGCALMSPRPSWTEGPFTTEARARESLQWQFAVPVIEKAVSV